MADPRSTTRTTLTLDDDIADKLKRQAERRGVSFKDVVNAALRTGLAARDASVRKRPYQVQVFDSPLCRGIDPMKLNQLSDELEVDHEMRRLVDTGTNDREPT
jgi:hypothetical protein